MTFLCSTWCVYVVSGLVGCGIIAGALECLVTAFCYNEDYARGELISSTFRFGLPIVLCVSAIRLWTAARLRRCDVLFLLVFPVFNLTCGVSAGAGLALLCKMTLLSSSVPWSQLPAARAWFEVGLIHGTAGAAVGGLFFYWAQMVHSQRGQVRKALSD